MTVKQNSTKEIQDLREKYVPRGVGNGNVNIADFASGSTVTDIDGKEWIDFAGAIGVLNTGHTHPKVTDAVKNQVNKFLHPGFNVVMYEGYIRLAEKLTQVTPGDFDKQAILFNSGAEAVENVVKVARRYTNRPAVVSFKQGFHGRTNLTMGMTSKVKPYKIGFGPFASEMYQAPFPNMYHKPDALSEEAYIDETIEAFKDFFLTTVAPETVSCVVMEPIQGEGGFIIPPKRFVQFVNDFCKEHGILFVADEIQTGMGRTGKLFASEHYDIVPDLMTVSKSLAAGLPLSAVVGRKDVLNTAGPGELGGTFAGNPVACAAALAVFDVIEEESLLEKSETVGQKIEDKLQALANQYDFVGNIRRLGSMVAVELVTDQTSKAPNAEQTNKIKNYANEQGLLLLSAGLKGNVLRFLAPLNISDQELEKGLSILEDGFKQ